MRWMLLVPFLSVSAFCDFTVWRLDMSTLPDGWVADDNWSFSEDGASVYMCVNEYYAVDNTSMVTSQVMVPDFCDSLVLHCEQELTAFAAPPGGGAVAYAGLRYRYGDGDWETIWLTGDVWYSVEPLHVAIPVMAWEPLQLQFHGFVGAGTPYSPGEGIVDWLISHLDLTMYGDGLSLEPSTWAGVKSCFD